MRHSAQHSYLFSDSHIRELDSYTLDEKTKASLDHFFSSLPKAIQEEVKKRAPHYDVLTSCQGEMFFPRIEDTYVVSMRAGNLSQVDVYTLDGTGRLIDTFDISNLVGFKPNNSDDYLEIQCRHGTFILSNPLFKLNSNAIETASLYQKSNRSVIQARSRQANTYGIFGYNPNDKKFHFLGTYPVEGNKEN